MANSCFFLDGDVCTTEQEANPCTGLPHSVCKDSFCVCQPGYFPKNKKCYAELGEKTDSIELCPEDPFLTYSDVDKRCGCGSARFYNPSLRTCNKRKSYRIYVLTIVN